jgi:hypothetical protein
MTSASGAAAKAAALLDDEDDEEAAAAEEEEEEDEDAAAGIILRDRADRELMVGGRAVKMDTPKLRSVSKNKTPHPRKTKNRKSMEN